MAFKPNEKELTRISPHAKIKGNLTSEGDVIIEGGFSGQIKTTGHLHIISGAKVNSSIQCETARVDGTVEGEVKAASRLEIGAGGVIVGNIDCEVLFIEPGAHLSGQCSMMKKEKILLSPSLPSREEMAISWAEDGFAYGTKQKEKKIQTRS